MADLLSTQRAFAAALRDAAQSVPALSGDAEHIRRRLAIYRGNVAGAIVRAMTSTYPVVARVVGEAFFEGLARACLRESPSTSGDLHDYGAGFAGFVERFPHAQELPYLPDLARLEWAVHCAYGAADAESLDQSALARVAPELQSGIRFDWAAGTAVISSSHPIARIWTIHQADGDFSVDLSTAESALVTREGLHVAVSALAPGEAVFIQRSLDGASLGEATEAATAADDRFDLAGLLGRAIGSGWICGFTARPSGSR